MKDTCEAKALASWLDNRVVHRLEGSRFELVWARTALIMIIQIKPTCTPRC
jgi:hypothetical protein